MFLSQLQENKSILIQQDNNLQSTSKRKSSNSQQNLNIGSKQQQDQIDLIYYKQQGDKYLQSGRISKALETYVTIAAELEKYESFDEVNQQLYQDIIQILCDESMKQLSLSDFEKALDILFTAESITSNPQLQNIDKNKTVLVLNNIGCVYRRMNRLPKALQYLDKAQKLVEQSELKLFAGVTYLNICAVCSQLGQHQQAQSYAQSGLIECQNQLNEVLSDPQQKFNQKLIKEKARYVAISYHNIAVEEEFQKNYSKSIDYYKEGFEILQKHNGGDDPLVQKMKQSYMKAKEKSMKFQQKQDIKGIQITKRPLSASSSQLKLKNVSITGKMPQIKQQQPQIQTPTSFESPGFYFKKNKIMAKQPQKQFKQPDIQKIQKKFDSESEFFTEDQQSVRPVKMQNLFPKNNESEIGIKMGNSKRMIKSVIRESDLSRASQSHEKEMSDLEKMGVLKWSDSEASDAEDELMKQQRLNFLKSLNDYDQQQAPDPNLVQNLQTQQQQPQQQQNPSQDAQPVIQPLQKPLNETQKKTKKNVQIENYEAPEDIEWNEAKVISIQRHQRFKIRKREGKKIQEEQAKVKEEYLAEKLRKKLELEEIQRQEEERRQQILKEQREEEERLRKIEEEKLALQELELKRQEDERLRQEELARQRAHEEFLNQTSAKIQKTFMQQKEKFQKKQEIRGPRTAKIQIKKIEKQKQLSFVFQKYVKRALAIKEKQLLLQSKKNRPYQIIKRKIFQLKECVNDIFVEGKTCHRGNYILTFGLIGNLNQYQDASLQIIVNECKGYEKDGFENYQQQPIRLIKDKNKLSINLNFFHMNDKVFKLREILCGKLDMAQKKDFIFLINQLEPFIYIKQGLIYIEEITDTEEYQGTYIKSNKKPLLSHENLDQLNHSATIIQKHVRGKKCKQRVSFMKMKRYEVIKVWSFVVQMDHSREDYFTIKYYKDVKTLLQFLKGKNNTTGKKTKALEWYPALQRLYKVLNQIKREDLNPLVTRSYKELTQENLEELIDINSLTNSIEYTELVKSQLGVDDENLRNKKKYDLPKVNEKALRRFQARLRAIIIRIRYKWIKAKKQKIHDSDQRNMLNVTKRQYLKNNIIYKFQLIYDKNNKVITVTCRNISRGHIMEKENIHEYKQVMFDEFTLTDLYFYGPKLLNQSELRENKKDGIKKIYVPRIEELMANITFSVKQALGLNSSLKDNSVEARKILNEKRMRTSYRKHQSIIDMLDVQPFINRTSFINIAQAEIFAKGIQKQFEKHKNYRNDHIKKAKECKSQIDLEKYAMNVKPTSVKLANELKVEVLEERRQMELEGEKYYKKEYSQDGGEEVALDKIIQIVNEQTDTLETWDIDVWYIPKYKCLMLECYHNVQHPKILSVAINVSLLQYPVFDIKLLKLEMETRLLERLRYDGRNIHFQEIILATRQQVQEEKQIKGGEQFEKFSEQEATLVNLPSFNKGQYQCQYSISVSNNVIICVIVYKPDTRIKTNVQFKLSQFDCRCIIDLVKKKNTKELEKFFAGILNLITTQFEFKIDYTPKIPTIQTNVKLVIKKLPTLLLQVFILRIQRQMKVFRLNKNFKVQKLLLKAKEFFLMSYQFQLTVVWLEIRFFVNKEQSYLKMTIQKQPLRSTRQKKKVFLIDILKLKTSMDFSFRSDHGNDPLFLTDNKWLDIQGARSRQYYIMIFKEFLNYLMKHMEFQVLNENLTCTCLDPRIPLKEEKKSKGKVQVVNKKSVSALSILSIQRVFRLMRTSEIFKIRKIVEQKRIKQIKLIGNHIKRAFRQIGRNIYIINAYHKDNLYTFDLINTQKRRESKDPNSKIVKIRGVYEYNPDKLLNTRDKPLVEYLLESIYFINEREEEISFRENYLEDFNVAKGSLNKTQVDFSEAASDQFTDDGTGDGVPPKIISNLVDYVHDKDKDGNDRIYNVVYTGKRPKPFKQKSQIQDQSDKNQIVISVDLGELKKLYPKVNSQSQGLMKEIGEQFIESLAIDKKGQVLINYNKINPFCVKVQENSVIKQRMEKQENQNQVEEIKEEQQPEHVDFKKILVKNTKFFSKVKFLILIYLVERKVTKIVKSDQDNVFEEYEVLYQVNGINLSHKDEPPYIWEVILFNFNYHQITPEEIRDITVGLNTVQERARYLMKRIQIFNNRFIFLVDKKEHINKIKKKDNMLTFYEKGLQPIQLHFRNRKFKKNFQQYIEELKSKKENIIYRVIPEEMQTLKNFYILVCFSKRKMLEFVCWDLVSFESYRCEIDKTPYEKYFAKDQLSTVKILCKYFDVDYEKSILLCNQSVALEQIKKQFQEMAQSMKKSRLQEN